MSGTRPSASCNQSDRHCRGAGATVSQLAGRRENLRAYLDIHFLQSFHSDAQFFKTTDNMEDALDNLSLCGTRPRAICTQSYFNDYK
eukprot:6197193-Pleurochrysis_carterae.AAC.1